MRLIKPEGRRVAGFVPVFGEPPALFPYKASRPVYPSGIAGGDSDGQLILIAFLGSLDRSIGW